MLPVQWKLLLQNATPFPAGCAVRFRCCPWGVRVCQFAQRKRIYFDLRLEELQGWFSSAILRLEGVGLPIDFMQRRQTEIVSPFAKVL